MSTDTDAFEDRLARALAGAVNQTLIRHKAIRRVQWRIEVAYDTPGGRSEIDLRHTLDEFEPTSPEAA